MALEYVPTVDDLIETTGQTEGQLRKDREATVEMARENDAYEMMEARYGEEDFESAMENAVDPREARDE